MNCERRRENVHDGEGLGESKKGVLPGRRERERERERERNCFASIASNGSTGPFMSRFTNTKYLCAKYQTNLRDRLKEREERIL